MTEFEKQLIDNATYEELFAKVRFEPVASPWMMGETGKYLFNRFKELREKVGPHEHTRVSKKIGWGT